jgi:hypothetical protein
MIIINNYNYIIISYLKSKGKTYTNSIIFPKSIYKSLGPRNIFYYALKYKIIVYLTSICLLLLCRVLCHRGEAMMW